MHQLTADLPCDPPLDGAALLGFLRARAVPGVEDPLPGAHRRALRLPSGPGVAELAPGRDRVRVRLWLEAPGDAPAALARCRALAGLDADPRAAVAALARDPVLGPLVRRRPGLRVPQSADPAEGAVRAVLGQQVSLAGAATLAGRLAAAAGEPLGEPAGAVTRAFPAPAALAGLDPDALAMPRSRARALLALARALADGTLELRRGGDLAAARGGLAALPGIGPWTVEYVALRALGDPDAFPVTDLGLRRAAAALGLDPAPRALERASQAWRPHRAAAAQQLWAFAAAAGG